MSANPAVSEIYDKNGVTADIEAKRFDGTRTFAISGDVSGTQTWNGDSSTNMTINASIGSKKVTTDKINDKAVGTGQIDDGAVGLTQIDSNAMNGTVQDNDSNLATHAAVKTYVDSQISGQGTYLGKHTVAEVNAMQTDNLHNGDRVMLSDSGTINLGPGGVGFDVVAGEDLILYKSGSTVQWDSMDGNFKTKQTAVTVSGLGTTKTITSLTQNANGEISASASDIRSASTSQTGIVQLNDATDSTSTSQAATANAVKKAYDHADTLVASLDAEKTSTDGTNVQVKVTEVDGKVTAVSITTDNTENRNNKVTSWSGTPTDTNYPSEKLVKDSLDAIGSQSSTDAEVIAASLNDLNARVSVLESKDWNVLGDVIADSVDTQVLKVGGEDVSTGLSNKADKVASATNGNFAGLDSNGNLTDSGKKAADFATAAQGALADSAYQLPSGGIPKTDLASGVQASLDAADSAIQGVKVNGTALTPDANNVVIIPTASAGAHGTVEFMTSQEALDLLAAARLAAS